MSRDGQSAFDFRRARGPRSGPDVGEAFAGEGAGSPPMSVSALVARIKGALQEAFPRRVCVVGELSNVKLHTSGHLYFRLKDAGAAVDAAMFRPHASHLAFTPTDGLEVVVEGRVDVYDVRGQLQLYVERMTPKGAGALELAFRQIVGKLRGEGLFDPAAKVALPRVPRAIGVITSPTGAAVRDVRRTVLRRWRGLPVYLVPTSVQGAGAAEQIAQAIRLLDAAAERYEIDTILLVRGGGSLEDLWAFNEEVVARAVFAARTPIVSGVGHETDVTVCDLVADARAPTPTGAAEMAVPDAAELRRHLRQLAIRLRTRVREGFSTAQAALAAVLRSVVFRDPAARLRVQVQRLDEASHRLRAGLGNRLARARRVLSPLENRLAALHPARGAERQRALLDRLSDRLAWVLGGRSKREGDRLAALDARFQAVHPLHRLNLARQRIDAADRQLEALSYRNVLRRGFSVTRSAEGILRTVRGVRAGERIQTELADGTLDSRVLAASGAALPEPSPSGPAEKTPPRRPRGAAPAAPLFDGANS